MYTKTYNITQNDIGEHKQLSLTSLFLYLQKVMIANVDSYGATGEYHRKQGLSWVLVDYDIDILSLPKKGETVTFGTLPYSFKKYYGYRVYEAKNNEGIFVKGSARFVLMDFINKTLSIPSQEILDLFTDASKEPKTLPISKHRIIDGKYIKVRTYTVEDSDIDENNHMNNVKYLSHAIDTLKGMNFDARMVSNVRITYKKESYLGDQLTFHVIAKNDLIQIQINKNDTNISLVTLKLK